MKTRISQTNYIFLPKDLILSLTLPTTQINAQVEFLSNASTGMAGAHLAAQTICVLKVMNYTRKKKSHLLSPSEASFLILKVLVF